MPVEEGRQEVNAMAELCRWRRVGRKSVQWLSYAGGGG